MQAGEIMVYGKDNRKLKIERIHPKEYETASLAILDECNNFIAEIDLDEHGALQVIYELAEMLKIKHAND